MVKRSKTSPFHGGNPGSSPGGVTTAKRAELYAPPFCCAPHHAKTTSGSREERKLRNSAEAPYVAWKRHIPREDIMSTANLEHFLD